MHLTFLAIGRVDLFEGSVGYNSVFPSRTLCFVYSHTTHEIDRLSDYERKRPLTCKLKGSGHRTSAIGRGRDPSIEGHKRSDSSITSKGLPRNSAADPRPQAPSRSLPCSRGRHAATSLREGPPSVGVFACRRTILFVAVETTKKTPSGRVHSTGLVFEDRVSRRNGRRALLSRLYGRSTRSIT